MSLGNDLNLKATIDATVTGYERGIEQAIAATRRYEASLMSLEADMMALERSMDTKVAQALERQNAAMTKTGRAVFTFGAAAAVGIGLAVNEAIKWQSAWTGVTKTTNGSAAQMGELETQLRHLALILPATHEEIASVAESAGQLGVARGDIANFTKIMIDLGQSTNLSADEAATAIAQFMNVMGTASDKVDEIGNTIAALGNKGASTEADIMHMAQRLVGAGKLVGASEQDVLGLAAAMANLGIQSELGGGAMQRVMMIIYRAVHEGGDNMKGFAQLAGVSAEKFASKWSSDPIRAFNLLVQGMNRVKAGGGNLIEQLDQLGIKGTQNLQVILRLAGSGDMLSKSLGQSATAWDKNNALLIEAGKRYATTESKIAIARNQLRDSAIDMGSFVLPALAAMAGGIDNVITAWRDMPGPLKEIAGILAVATTAVALFGGAALIVVPKIAAFKAALAELEGGALKTAGTKLLSFGSILNGSWGLALAGGIAALGFFAAKHGEAVREVQALTDTLDTQSGAITDNTRQWVVKKMLDDGVLQNARDLGLNLGMVTDAALGNTTALAELNKQLAEFTTQTDAASVNAYGVKNVSGSSSHLADAAHDIQGTLNDTNSTLAKSREAWQLTHDAMGGATQGTKDAAAAQSGTTQAWQAGTTAADGLSQAVTTLGEDLTALSQGYLDNRAAARQVRDAIRQVHDSVDQYVKDHGSLTGAFKRGSKSADDFNSQLDAVATNMLGQLKTTEQLTNSHKKVQQQWWSDRATLIKLAEQIGYTKEQAKEYVDQVLQAPGIVAMHFTTPGLDDAMSKTLTYSERLARLNGMTATVFINTVNTGAKLTGMAATGQVPSPSHRTHHADGGFSLGGGYVPRVPQIAEGGRSITWAEPSTGWEAYISGKPGMETRNRDVWAEAGRRLGMGAGAPGGGHSKVVVVQQQFPGRVVLDIGSHQFTAFVRQQADGVSRDNIAAVQGSANTHDRMDWSQE